MTMLVPGGGGGEKDFYFYDKVNAYIVWRYLTDGSEIFITIESTDDKKYVYIALLVVDSYRKRDH